MLIAALCAEGDERDPQRARDRPRLRADRRAPARRSARGSSASRRRDPPDPQRHARRPAGRDARAARDHRGDARRCSTPRGYGEVATPALEYEDGADARRPGGGRPGLQAVRRARQRARAALGHDDPDRARGRDALRDAPSRRCASATSPTPTAPCARSAGRRARCCRRGSSWSARPGRRARPRRSTRAVRGARRGRAGRLPGRARRRVAVPARCSTRSACPTRRAAAILHELVTRDFVGLEREVERARRTTELLDACRSCAAAPRCSTASRRPSRAARACYDLLAARRCAERVIFDLGLVRDARLLHGRGVRGLRRRARRPARRRRALRRPARPLRPRPAGLRAGR